MSVASRLHSQEIGRGGGNGKAGRKGMDAGRAMSTQAFKALQAHWYGKLRRTKFNEDGKLDPNGQEFRDLDPRNQADHHAALLLNADWGGRKDGRRFKRYVTFSQIQPDATDEQAIEAQLAANAKTFGTITNLADTPTARAWQAISRAANDLPPGYRHRGFLVDLAQTGVIAGYLLRRHKLRESAARGAFERFLAERGMGEFRNLLIRGPVRPTP